MIETLFSELPKTVDFLSILLATIISQPFLVNFDSAFLISSLVSAAKPITSSGLFFDFDKSDKISGFSLSEI